MIIWRALFTPQLPPPHSCPSISVTPCRPASTLTWLSCHRNPCKMEPVNFDSLFSAAEERQRWASSPAQRRRGGTSQGSAGGDLVDLNPRTVPGSDGSSPAQRRRGGTSQGSSDPGSSGIVQQSRSMPAGDLRHQAIANNISNRLQSPTKKAPVIRSLRPESTPQLTRRGTTFAASPAGLRRSSSMRDCTEWTRTQNKQKVAFDKVLRS